MANELPPNLGVYVNLTAVYPDAVANEDAMRAALANLTRDDALFWCARVNTVAAGSDVTMSPEDRQRELVKQFCDPKEVAALNAFALQHGGISNITVFFRGQMLELARWVVAYCAHDPTDGETFSDPAVRAAFFRAALIASDLWGQRVFADRLTLEGTPEEQLQRALGAFRKAIEEGGQANHTGVALGRGWLLFSRYMPGRMEDFSALFETATGLTLVDYFTCATALMLYTFPRHEGGPLFRTDYVAAQTAFSETFAKFISLRAQSPEELGRALRESFAKEDYKSLRRRPIVNFERGRSAIFDPVFFTENLSIAPLFDLAGRGRDQDKGLFGAFGYAFEDYVTDTLRSMFPETAEPAPKLTCNVAGKTTTGLEFECDAILDAPADACIFEIKAAWLREEFVLADDPESFINQIRAKYGAVTAEVGTSGKGVAQLARSVGALAREEWQVSPGRLPTAKSIYPILLVHDERMALTGFGRFLDQEFKKLLGEVPANITVQGLIVISISDLENLASSVENFGFMEFIEEYSAVAPDRALSLHNFLSGSRFSALVKPPETLMEATNALVETMKGRLFPVGSSSAKTVPDAIQESG